MPNPNTKRLSVHYLQPGMVLAEDAVTPGGQLLVPTGTTITQNHLFRMNLYQILSAVIYAVDIPEETSELMSPASDPDYGLSIMDSPIVTDLPSPQKTEAFLRFSSVYMKVDDMVHELFDEIQQGHAVDSARLLSGPESIIKSVRLTNEMFTYMSHIQVSDYHTYVHGINTAILCNIFGQWLKMPQKDIDELTIAGLIHDIGKVKVSEDLLNKSDKLTAEEFDAVRQHAVLGYEIIKDSQLSDRIKQAVLLHHERTDGSGYPYGFKVDEIPDFARIIAIVDVYDAMTSSRSYHEKFSPFNVIQILEQASDVYLDTDYLFTFLENIAHYYLGEEVLLNDGTIGKIVFLHNQSPSRPIIKAGDDMIDLRTTPSLKIVEVL